MQRFVALLAVALVAGAGLSAAVQPAEADQLGVYIRPNNEHRPDVSTPEGGSINVPEGELRRRLEAALNKTAQEIPEWQCLGGTEPNERGKPPIAGLQIEYDLTRTEVTDLARGRVRAWEVNLRTLVSSKKFSGWIRGTAYVFGDEYHDQGRRDAATGEAFMNAVVEQATKLLREAVAEALKDGHNPCELITKLSGVARMDMGDSTLTYTYAAESTLKLNASGAFDATSPMSLTIDMTFEANECMQTVTARMLEPKLQSVGTYRAADGTLSFKELRMSSAGMTGQGSVVCPGGGSAACSLDTRTDSMLRCTNAPATPIPFSTMGGDLLEGKGLTIALRDGERQPLPRPEYMPAGTSWDMSLSLGYAVSTPASAPVAVALLGQ